MEGAANAMAAEIGDDGVAVLFRVALDRVADIAQRCARLYNFNPAHEAFIGGVHQLGGFDGNLAHGIHAAGIAKPAIELGGDVNIDDIAFYQRAFARNAMADNMID